MLDDVVSPFFLLPVVIVPQLVGGGGWCFILILRVTPITRKLDVA